MADCLNTGCTKILPRNRNMIKTPDTPTQFEIVGIKFSLYRSNHQGSLWISAYCDDGSIFGQVFQAQNSVFVQIWQIVNFGIFSMFVHIWPKKALHTVNLIFFK